jgi:hypothetical protein
MNPDGSDRSKAPVVITPYQKSDYRDIYTPLVKLKSFWIMIAFAEFHECQIYHMDMVAALWILSVDVDVYMVFLEERFEYLTITMAMGHIQALVKLCSTYKLTIALDGLDEAP